MSFVLRRNIALYTYALIHGVISGVAFMIFPHLVSFRMMDDRISSSPWIWALVAGIFTRSLLQLNLFTIGTGPTTIKVGYQRRPERYSRDKKDYSALRFRFGQDGS